MEVKWDGAVYPEGSFLARADYVDTALHIGRDLEAVHLGVDVADCDLDRPVLLYPEDRPGLRLPSDHQHAVVVPVAAHDK